MGSTALLQVGTNIQTEMKIGNKKNWDVLAKKDLDVNMAVNF